MDKALPWHSQNDHMIDREKLAVSINNLTETKKIKHHNEINTLKVI